MTVSFFFLISLTLAGLCWGGRAIVAEGFLSTQLKVPVTIHSIEIEKGVAVVSQLKIGNPLHSRTPTSFSADNMEIFATHQQLFGPRFTLDEIRINDIFIGIELYDADGKNNNWAHIAGKNQERPSKKGRGYLVKTLILNNVNIQLTRANGTVKKYPTIDQVVLNDISEESGFPLHEIEKAIFNQMMQDLFRKLNLDQLIDTIDPFQYIPGAAPLKIIPDVFQP